MRLKSQSKTNARVSHGRSTNQPKGELWKTLREAVEDSAVVSGLTHDFYRYPARFSPRFAQAAIKRFSSPGDVILDPFMGGGTTIVQALASGRKAIGNDCNSLSVFVARVKTTPLTKKEQEEILCWCSEIANGLNYHHPKKDIASLLDDGRTKNLEHFRARAIKKALAIALNELETLSSKRVQDFARCVLLRTSQWALDGRKKHTTISEFRERLPVFCADMLTGLTEFTQTARQHSIVASDRILIQGDTKELDSSNSIIRTQVKADLVVTSPPYPGIHVLYHRWQINGRRESPAPYWIANCQDGHGASYYTFGDRKRKTFDRYFSDLYESFSSIRKVMRQGGLVVQLVAFSNPKSQLSDYINVMNQAGFDEVNQGTVSESRIQRQVPNRKWHANLKGKTSGATEFLLVHRAI